MISNDIIKEIPNIATRALNKREYIESDADNGLARKPEDKYRKMFTITMGLCLADLYMRTHVFNARDVLGRGHRNIVFMIKEGKVNGYFSEEDIEEMGIIGLRNLKDKGFVKKNILDARDNCEALYDFSEYLNSLDLRHIDAPEMLNLYNALFDKIRSVYGYFNVSQPCISFALEKEIKRELEKLGVMELKQQELLQELLGQDEATLVEEEEFDLLNLAVGIKREEILVQLFKNDVDRILRELPAINRRIKRVSILNDRLDLHVLRYGFLASYENFDRFHKRYYIDRIKQIINFKEHILEEKKNKTFPIKKELEELRSMVFKKNEIPEHLQHLINVARIYSHQRMYIRTYFTKGISVLRMFYDEFAYRMGISPSESRYLMNDEINSYFLGNKQVNREEVANRMQLSVFRIKDDIPTLLSGKEAEEFRNKYLPEENVSDITELKGTIANKGYAKGRVKVLSYGKNMAKQIEEMKKGDILIAGNTRPEVIVACQKASAIVTDEGGILSHAALVSREFGIPCIVGTYKATRIFKDGDIVEVDANKGIIRKVQGSAIPHNISK